MTIIRRTIPLGELISIRHATDRLVDDPFVDPRNGLSGNERQFALDIRTVEHQSWDGEGNGDQRHTAGGEHHTGREQASWEQGA